LSFNIRLALLLVAVIVGVNLFISDQEFFEYQKVISAVFLLVIAAYVSFYLTNGFGTLDEASLWGWGKSLAHFLVVFLLATGILVLILVVTN